MTEVLIQWELGNRESHLLLTGLLGPWMLESLGMFVLLSRPVGKENW